jgi:hypothetical protein
MTTDPRCIPPPDWPNIVDARDGDYVVRVPGSVYQPLLLKPFGESVIQLAPGALEANEARFIRDLLRQLYPNGHYPASGQPLHWHGKELWLARNLDRREDAFRLRVEGSDWFYPDFLIWIIDRQQRIQTLGFIDPKGLREGADGGWWDYKVVATLYSPHVLERQLAASQQQLVIDGVPWTFRVRGVLLSTTTFTVLASQGKFRIKTAEGASALPNRHDFAQGRIIFQPVNSAATSLDNQYIEDVLMRLVQDAELDHCMACCAEILETQDSHVANSDEVKPLLTFIKQNRDQPITEIIGDVIRDYIRG